MDQFIVPYHIPARDSSIGLPFDIQLNFNSLIKYWEEKSESKEGIEAEEADLILNKLQHRKELSKPMKSIESLKKYEQDVRILLKPLFSPILTLNEIKACVLPFHPYFIRPTERFQNILKAAGKEENIKLRIPDVDTLYRHACIFFLNFFYGANIAAAKTIFYDIEDQQNGVVKHYRTFFNGDFSTFKLKPGTKKLTKKDIQELKDNFTDIEFWKKKIPPGSVTYEGFGLVTLFDVSTDEAVSELKLNLLKKDALTNPVIVNQITKNMCDLINISSLRIGFASYEKSKDQFKSLGYGFWNSIMLSDKNRKKGKEILGEEIWNLLINEKEPVFVSDLRCEAKSCPFVANLSENNIGGYMAAPLSYNNQLIGILELGSADTQGLDRVTYSNLEPVISLFTTALKRSLDEYQNQLEALIQEKCTAIHPTVSWRFFEAAENLIRSQQFFDVHEMEDIVFDNVYPLYAQHDIKNSSVIRNEAICADLKTQLNMAKAILTEAHQFSKLPIYDELGFRIDRHLNQMEEGIGAGDELRILGFLKKEIYPVFSYLKENYEHIGPRVLNYEKTLNKELGIIYDKRKDYEESLNTLNSQITEYLETAQVKAQTMFPHYFEKYKTDGVEFDMYIGQALVNGLAYHPLHLQNLRLWQLLVVCEIENEVALLRNQLKVPLEICSLVLIHGNSLAIRFRKDEKRFDVDGSYNIRYEIIKKRIDKAHIKDTDERLTQPGKLSIVYSQDKEANEYSHYLNYLKSIDYVTGDIEWLELEELQGLQRLKALRISIRYHDGKEQKQKYSEQVAELIKTS